MNAHASITIEEGGCEQPLCNPLSVNDYFHGSRQWHSHFDAIALSIQTLSPTTLVRNMMRPPVSIACAALTVGRLPLTGGGRRSAEQVGKLDDGNIVDHSNDIYRQCVTPHCGFDIGSHPPPC